MKTRLRFQLLALVLLCTISIYANTGAPGQRFQEEALAAIGENDPGCFFDRLNLAADAFRNADDLEGWLKLYKEAGKSLRGSDWPDAVPQAIAVMNAGLNRDFGRSPNTEEEWDALIWLHVNLGYIYQHYNDDYQGALGEYETACRLFQNHFEEDDYYTVNYIYRPLANLYSRFGDFQTAIELLHTSYRFFKSTDRASALSKVLNDLAIAEELSGRTKAALGHIEEALQLGSLRPKDLVLLYSARARILGVLGENEKALAAIQSAFSALPAVEGIPEANLREWEGTLWNVRGSLHAALGQWEKSTVDFERGEHILSTSGAISYRRSLGKLLVDKGEMLRMKGAHQPAIQTFQKAIQALSPAYVVSGSYNMPDLAMLYPENTFSEALTGWANCLWSWYQEEGGETKLKAILTSGDLVFEIEQMLRRRYQGESAKLINVQGLRARTELGVQAALELWGLTADDHYKEIAFNLTERSKSLLLREAMQKSNAEQRAKLPSEVLKRERELQQALADLEEEWFLLQSEGANTSKIGAAQTALLRNRQAYSAWIDSLEAGYPEYYQLKYSLEVATVSDIQAGLLEGNQALIEYFVGKNLACAFIVTSTGFEVISLNSEFPLDETVRALRMAIEEFQFSKSNRQDLCEQYREASLELYKTLMFPVESAVELPEHLLIIPSGVLGLLPFDALLTAETSHCNFSAMPYLINTYEVSYGYSATFQHSVNQRNAGGEGMVAFAPEFDGRGGFGALAYNEHQVNAVTAMFGGNAFVREQASLDQFRSYAPGAGILHFSTHAQANTEADNFSFIVFSNGESGYDSLFVKDIYLMSLQSELVVLNGCETFVGKWYNGEGVVNLARSFLAAGANSVVSSLWAINDEASSSVMESFYRSLKSGATRSAALRTAKQQQISKGGKLGAHPVYWAAFHPVGKSSALPGNANRYSFLLWSLLALGMVGGFMIWWKARA
ncbi:MAG: CHAT domain-containing protein [Mameliella sp.]|nr:CHAT domain-containing protein [Phaeodactylibacter sp.]